MQPSHHTATQQQRVQEWMRKSPLRITRARSSVAAVLLRQAEPITAELLFRRLLDIGEDVSLGSVYRILKQMEEDGLVLRDRHVSSGGIKAVYAIASVTAPSRAYVFRCDVCHRQQRIADAVLAVQLANVATLEGYALGTEIVIPARCRDCVPAAGQS
ncbi:hypothetical protein GJ698_10990 [Pseudoduganella sp. FT26W]|uniref:Ferric uptake regulation protein n=1 Tax=Duganella aquatilis TaxID=2666082 RepID=A0A844D0X8_9BURK|nr:transcriptional repressor [Duganella aquatilis]MRW84611.1 hypothetical protein [Duganella aquatilis]